MVVPFRRVIFCLCIGWILSSVAWRSVWAFDDWTEGLNGYQPAKIDADYYRAHAKPERGAPHATDNGAWFVETDRETGLSEPRLIQRANGRSVATANAALEAVQGHLLRLETARRHHYQLERFGPAIVPGAVTVSYFSPTTLSYIVRGERQTDGSMPEPIVRGTTLDIERGTISTVQPCQSKWPYFRLGHLLEVCDRTRLAMFRRLWLQQAQHLQATVPRQAEEWQEWCRATATQYIDFQDEQLGSNFGFVFSLYLSPKGLAVHQEFTVTGPEGWCVLDPNSPFFPTVIPWNKVAPLMNPGALRDELLALP